MQLRFNQLFKSSFVIASIVIFATTSQADTYDRERIQNMLSSPKILQSRKHIIAIDLSHQTNTFESDSSEEELHTQKYGLGYGQNFRRFEAGLRVLQINSENKITDTQSSSLQTQVYARLNIIQNIPEEFFIPYVEAGVGQINGFKNHSNTTIEGTSTHLSLGLDWYPFREYIALGFEFKSETQNVDLSGSLDEKGKIVQTGFNLNYRFVF